MPKHDKYHAKWKAHMAKCSKYHAKCKVTMPKCSKYHAKWQVLAPNCCKYKANGTGKESKKTNPKPEAKKIPKLFYTLKMADFQGTPNLSNQQHAILERNASFCCFSRCIASSRGLFASLEDILQMLQGYCFHRVCQERTSHSVKECYMSFRTKVHFKDHHMS